MKGRGREGGGTRSDEGGEDREKEGSSEGGKVKALVCPLIPAFVAH